MHAIKLRTVNWNGQILRRNGLLKQCIGGKLEDGKTGRRRKQLLDDLT